MKQVKFIENDNIFAIGLAVTFKIYEIFVTFCSCIEHIVLLFSISDLQG